MKSSSWLSKLEETQPMGSISSLKLQVSLSLRVKTNDGWGEKEGMLLLLIKLITFC